MKWVPQLAQMVVTPMLGAVVLSACAATPPTPATAAVTTAALIEVAPAPPERWIRVRKTEHTLTLYDGQQPIRTYSVVFGKDPIWSKLYQGDHRTPEGEYHISDKYYHPFWSRFLMLDYPTPYNREIYAWSLANGVLPVRGRGVPGIGGAVGIHGTENETLNERGINWTEGCVSLLNHDIDELYDLVAVGTRVVIER